MSKHGNVDELLERLKEPVISPYPELIVDVETVYGKLRVHLTDESFIDVWISRRSPSRYTVHWERPHVDGTIYRWDDTPMKRINTYRRSPGGRDDMVRPHRYLEALRSYSGRYLST